ncbi:MAG: amidohydrolase family protein [Candidatus Sumerlaeota bacterium]|nr:amidohydrolase family protein [Candidatus Sumerlaeota bacterium]
MNKAEILHPIDVHTHIFPDELAARAMEALMRGAPAERAFSNGTRVGLLAQMDKAGVGRAVVAAIATRPKQTPAIFNFSRSLKADSRLIPFASIHPAAGDAMKWIKEAAREFVGLKFHAHYQDIDFQSPQFIALLKAARDAGLVILLHAGQDPAYPGDMRARPEAMARLLDAVGPAKIIAAHLGGWLDWEDVLRYLVGREDLYFDTASSLVRCPKETALAIIRKHGADRILFASDSPWQDILEERQRLESLGLADDDLRKILYENAERIFNLPLPV